MGDDIWSDEGNFCAKLSGTLSFSDQTSSGCDTQARSVRSWSRVSRVSTDNLTDCSSPSGSEPKKVVFDIISAHTINDPGKKKYVSYTILVKTRPGLDNCPAIIERRYSDFLLLFQSIRKVYPQLVQDLTFPKKAVLGNFTADVITERSTSFHSFLTYLNSNEELRQSRQLQDFLHYKEVQKAQKMMTQCLYEDAVPLLENAVFLQQKFLTGSSYQIFWTTCLLVTCLNAADNLTDAQKYAELALEYFDADTYVDCPLYIPLLQLSIHVWWSLGRDKKDLEERLSSYRLKSLQNTSKCTTLLDAVKQHQFPF